MNEPHTGCYRLENLAAQRTAMIADLKPNSETQTIAGRLLEVSPTGASGIISDESGSVKIIWSEPNPAVARNDLVGLHGSYQRQTFIVTQTALLVKSQAESVEKLPPRNVLQARAAMLQAVRTFFVDRGYLEIETPALGLAPDHSLAIKVFESRYEDEWGVAETVFLPTSPEPFMKRMVAEGYEKVFQIGKFFRNGERGTLHNPEFTGVEWYHAYTDYNQMMDLTQALIIYVAQSLGVTAVSKAHGPAISLTQQWRRSRFYELLESTLGRPLAGIENPAILKQLLQQAGFWCGTDETLEDLLLRLFVHSVEPDLGYSAPTFVIDYPVCMGAMAKRKLTEPNVVERFELYLAGVELCNGYTELNEPDEQRQRFETDRRRKYPQRDIPLDAAFLAALRYGIPPCSGNALGLDRLLMLLLGKDSISEVRPFMFQGELNCHKELRR